MTPTDLAAVQTLCVERNVHDREYERFLALEGAFGFVLELGEQIVGAVTAMRYFEHGFLGPVLLPPEQEGVGLSLALTTHVVRGLHDSAVTCIETEATADEAIVLQNLGFERVRKTFVMERRPKPAGADETRAMTRLDMLDVGALDAEAYGFGRKEYLVSLFDEFPEGARVIEKDGDIEGFAMLRRSKRGYHLGPVVTKTSDPTRLIEGAIAQVAGYPIVALAPEGESAEALARVGFEAVGELVRMRSGQPPTHGAATAWASGGRITG